MVQCHLYNLVDAIISPVPSEKTRIIREHSGDNATSWRPDDWWFVPMARVGSTGCDGILTG